MTERIYMERAIELAMKGMGWTNPNPLVGAVIEKDGCIIGEGYHEKYGQLHAERNALTAVRESACGATMYVTLEPCCHYGKTPPCTEAIIESGIRKVVIGSKDPNPKVAGKGIEILRNAGIEVVEDFMKEECDSINSVFFHYIQNKTPYVVVKSVVTADGKTATKTGASKWITGEEARQRVQKLRHRYMGIMTGIGTVLVDDPMLNVRVEGLKSPVRIICDSHLRIPLGSRILKSADELRTIIAYADAMDEKIKEIKKTGAELWKVDDGCGQVDLKELMRKLGEDGIDSILLEGGGTLNHAAIFAGIVNQVDLFIAPKIFGGKTALTSVDGEGIEVPDDAVQLKLKEVEMIGEDLFLEYSCIRRK